ncbi:hypothetical protein E4U54_006387, partial [Claviceps lovelessii]
MGLKPVSLRPEAGVCLVDREEREERPEPTGDEGDEGDDDLGVAASELSELGGEAIGVGMKRVGREDELEQNKGKIRGEEATGVCTDVAAAAVGYDEEEDNTEEAGWRS